MDSIEEEEIMDCMNIDPSRMTFCDVNRPCESCPRFADDCDGEPEWMEESDDDMDGGGSL